jgi:hypothetical protein
MTASDLNLTRARASVKTSADLVPRTIPGILLLCGATAAIFLIPSGSYRTVALAVVWAPYLILRPKAGLWFTPALVMAASLLAPPEGYKSGWGPSPELPFWAIAISISFVATAVGAALTPGVLLNRGRRPVRMPLPLYIFLGVSVAAATLGLARGYSMPDVGKQLFGCLLFVGYFWLAIALTPRPAEARRVMKAVAVAALLFSCLYLAVYVPVSGLLRDTPQNDYSGSLAVLLLPDVLSLGSRARRKALGMMAVLLAVVFVNTLKRSVLGFGVCVLLLFGLRSRSKTRRYLWLLGSQALIVLLLATPALNYLGRAVAKQPLLSRLIPADVQTNYSVYLRAVQAEQILASTGGPSLLGTGLGSTLSWYDPYAHAVWTQETVDVGWAYVLIKLGILGLAVFLWLIGGILLRAVRQIPRGVHLGLVLLVVFFAAEMVADPMFVYFTTAPWIGAACGWLHVFNERADGVSARLSATAHG